MVRSPSLRCRPARSFFRSFRSFRFSRFFSLLPIAPHRSRQFFGESGLFHEATGFPLQFPSPASGGSSAIRGLWFQIAHEVDTSATPWPTILGIGPVPSRNFLRPAACGPGERAVDTGLGLARLPRRWPAFGLGSRVAVASLVTALEIRSASASQPRLASTSPRQPLAEFGVH